MPVFSVGFQTQNLKKTHCYISPSALSRGRGWSQAAEYVVRPAQQRGRGALGYAVPEDWSSWQFICLILGLNLSFVPCHCLTLQVIPLPLGSWECLPPGACVPQIPAVPAACKEAPLRKNPCCSQHYVQPCWNPLLKVRSAGSIHLFQWPCPKGSC